jgi:hypothetical protein
MPFPLYSATRVAYNLESPLFWEKGWTPEIVIKTYDEVVNQLLRDIDKLNEESLVAEENNKTQKLEELEKLTQTVEKFKELIPVIRKYCK